MGRWRLPPDAVITLVGFQRKKGDPIVYEGETPVEVRLLERLWRFQKEGDSRELTSCRWRLELVAPVKKGTPSRPGHEAMIAQEPYGNGWTQSAKFKSYSKKGERPAREIPADWKTDPVDWLERNIELDPWEQSEKYVSGISFPNGYWAEGPRNAAGDFLFGACPDREAITADLFASHEIKNLLAMTENNTIRFAFPGQVPSLEPETIEQGTSMMGLAILQALAGPESLGEWTGRLVADFVSYRYRSHLNNFNRSLVRRADKEVSSDENEP